MYSQIGSCLQRNHFVCRATVIVTTSRQKSSIIPSTSCLLIILWCIYAIEILQLSRGMFWNLIGAANSKAAEVNSLNSDKLPGFFWWMAWVWRYWYRGVVRVFPAFIPRTEFKLQNFFGSVWKHFCDILVPIEMPILLAVIDQMVAINIVGGHTGVHIYAH